MAKFLTERGLVLGKRYVESKESFIYNNQAIAAQPEKYLLTVVVGSMREGFLSGTTLLDNVLVDKLEFDKVEFMNPCEIDYEYGEKRCNFIAYRSLATSKATK